MSMQSYSETYETYEIDEYERKRALKMIAKFSPRMFNAMLAHANGPQPIMAGNVAAITINALRDHGLLTVDGFKRPRQTFPTRMGRKVIGLMLENCVVEATRQNAAH